MVSVGHDSELSLEEQLWLRSLVRSSSCWLGLQSPLKTAVASEPTSKLTHVAVGRPQKTTSKFTHVVASKLLFPAMSSLGGLCFHDRDAGDWNDRGHTQSFHN